MGRKMPDERITRGDRGTRSLLKEGIAGDNRFCGDEQREKKNHAKAQRVQFTSVFVSFASLRLCVMTFSYCLTHRFHSSTLNSSSSRPCAKAGGDVASMAVNSSRMM